MRPSAVIPDGPFRLAMGLQALKLDAWIDADADLAADLREKRRLLAERPGEVLAALPESAEAQREALDLLAEHLPRRFPDLYRFAAGGLHVVPLGETVPLDAALAPIDAAGRLVQEDLCLMQADAAGDYCLTAASLCFPSRWRLAEKVGKPLAAIHAPVPGYDAALAKPVDRFFALLKADKPVERSNWSVYDDPALFQPCGHGRKALDPTLTAENAGVRLWLRAERQTLRRLPRTGAVLFTIRIHRWTLDAAVADRRDAAALLDLVRTLPPELALYKSMPAIRAPLEAFLARRAS